MKNIFSEYYKPTSEQIASILDNCFIVLDTNVFLNFYRYSDTTIDKLLEVLNQLRSQLWIPYHVGKEFHENRIDEIINQKNIYSDAKKEVNSLKAKFEDKNRNPFISPENFVLFDNLIKELDTSIRKYNSLLEEDTTLQSIDAIFDGKIGEKLSAEDLSKIFAEGKERYKTKTAPGFADEKDKPEDIRKYGDLIIWKQLIAHAEATKQNCLFITDDRKNDWWLIDKAKNIHMPLPSLRKEFFEKSNQIFYAFQPFNFLEIIKDKLKFEITNETIEEVKDLAANTSTSTDVETIFIKELKEGGAKKMGIALALHGFQVEIDLWDGKSIYMLQVEFPPIQDIKRKFFETLQELMDLYSLKYMDTLEIFEAFEEQLKS